jgi:hypothetical protein
VPNGDPHGPLDVYSRKVEDMMYDGLSLDEVEESIDATELASDEKAALWLLAWSVEARESERARERPALRVVTTHPRL